MHLREIKFMKIKSSDGEIHFQECKTDFCLNAKGYNEGEALELAKKEAKKTLILQRK